MPSFEGAHVTELPTTPPVADPATSIDCAFGTFILAARLYEASDAGLIDPVAFGNRHLGLLVGDGSDPKEKPALTLGARPYTKEKLHSDAYNLMNAAMGTLASATFEATATDCGLRGDTTKDPATFTDTQKLIEIVYQIRNAFAHGPHAPQWRVDKPRLRCRYVVTVTVPVQAVTLDIDFAAKHGKPVAYGDFTGIEGFLAICRTLHDVVKGRATAIERKKPCPCGSGDAFEACHGTQ